MEVTSTEQNRWTILSLMRWSTGHLEGKEFESPRLTTELLLTHVLQCRRIDLYTSFDRPLSMDELARFKELFKRRLAHEPLQYILGETEFMGLKIRVDRRVLIPRPETEVLVEESIKLSKEVPFRRILDIGIGSGNIAISLAKNIPMCEVDGIDISQDALDVAGDNIRLHGLEANVKLFQMDIREKDFVAPGQSYDLIVSNPPYIAQSDYESLEPEIRDHEPRIATTDGGNGQSFYQTLATVGKSYLIPVGWMCVEFGYGQHEIVASLFQDAGYSEIEIVADYGKIPRILKARWS